MPGLLTVVVTELAKYKLDFVVGVEFRLNKVGTEWAVECSYFFKGNE
jgi:hypothetical protein